MLAYVGSSREKVFHKEDCPQLARSTQPRPITVGEDPTYRPCRKCHPDAPRLKVWHAFCVKCNRKRIYPCPHNGGVQVEVIVDNPHSTIASPPRFRYRRWVWVENAHRYTA